MNRIRMTKTRVKMIKIMIRIKKTVKIMTINKTTIIKMVKKEMMVTVKAIKIMKMTAEETTRAETMMAEKMKGMMRAKWAEDMTSEQHNSRIEKILLK